MEYKDIQPFINSAVYAGTCSLIASAARDIYNLIIYKFKKVGIAKPCASELNNEIYLYYKRNQQSKCITEACELLTRSINAAEAMRSFKSHYNVTQKITI